MAVPGSMLVVFFVLLLVAALVAAGARWAVQEQGANPVLTPLAELLVPLLLGAAVTLSLALLVRGLAAWLGRRGMPFAALRPIEGISIGAVLVFLAIAAAVGAGSAATGLGLVGAGVALALQRPILAVAGWGAIRFGRIFREGDRIEVDGIVGDVLEVGLFSTRLWEIGSVDSPLPWGGAVTPMRPSGRIVALSNATFLENPVANASAHLPYVFDEFAVSVAYEADWRLARELLLEVGRGCIAAETHAEAAERFARLTQGLPGEHDFPREPTVSLAFRDSWIELRLRYLVGARERAAMRTALAMRWLEATAAHAARLPPVYPRTQPQRIDGTGRPEATAQGQPRG